LNWRLKKEQDNLNERNKGLFTMHPSTILRMQPTRAMRMFPTVQRSMAPTSRRMKAVHEEDQSAHTISQRLRKLRRIPPELIPLGAVVLVAVGFAVYSLGKKFVVDKTMRLTRQGKREE